MDEFMMLLTDLGLTSTEVSLYLCGLERDGMGVQDFAKKTGIKRPTIYHAMDTLMEKGLVAQKKVGNRTLFSMCPPEQIRFYIARQQDRLRMKEVQLERIIPLLAERHETGTGEQFSLVEYQGIEGVKTVFDTAIYCRSKRWDIIAPFQNFLREYEQEYAEYYLRARENNGIVARSLWERGMKERRLTEKEIQLRNPRFMPKSMENRFRSLSIIFDDKVAIISPLEGLSATLITSREISSMFRALFDGIWEVSEKYR